MTTRKADCEICGDSDHTAEAHGEALSILQPSNHSTEEWTDIVEGEAQSFNPDWQPTPMTEEESDDPESADWRISEAEQAINDAGYIIVAEDDNWLVFGKAE